MWRIPGMTSNHSLPKWIIISLISAFIICLLILKFCGDWDAISIQIAKYPDGKDFAFTITDDPDYSGWEDRAKLYRLIDRLGFRTTIAVWVLDNKHGSGENGSLTNTRGMTTSDIRYLKHLKDLQNKGFEICMHTAGPGNDLREETIQGYELFREQFGHYPRININHANNLEDIYWGKDRLSNRAMKFFYGLFCREDFAGHIEGSKYFWGDVCKKKTKYVRGWATGEINTLSVNKTMPYHDEDKPYVNWWFGCSDGYNCKTFNRLLSDENIERLVFERGTCIVYTHFAYGFLNGDAKIDEYFRRQMTKISTLDGWFVPASTILDRFLLLRNVKLLKTEDGVILVNNNPVKIKQLTVLTNKSKLYIGNARICKIANSQGEIIIGDMPPNSSINISCLPMQQMETITFLEKVTITIDWIKIKIFK